MMSQATAEQKESALEAARYVVVKREIVVNLEVRGISDVRILPSQDPQETDH